MPEQEQQAPPSGAPEDPRGAEVPPAPGEEPQAPPPQVVDPEAAEHAQRDGLPEDREATTREANDALASMLAAEGPPPVTTETVDMPELAKRMGIESFSVTLRGLSDPELQQCSDRAVKPPTKQQRKLGMTQGGPDPARLKRLLIAVATIDPNLSDQRLLERYGPTTEHVVQRWFLPGEIDALSEVVNDLTGYGGGAVERAKE